MTSSFGSEVNPLPSIHNPPPARAGVQRLTGKQVGAFGIIVVDLILAQVALALGGVTILGAKPFAFLTTWGNSLVQQASNAYKNNFAVVDAVAGNPAGTTSSGSLTSIYNATNTVHTTSKDAKKNTFAVVDVVAGNPVGTTTTGTTADVYTATQTVKTAADTAQTTVDNVKTKLTAGWTIDTITSSGTWTNPGNITLMWVVCFGGGAKGNTGLGSSGGAGGVAGDYVAQQINPNLLPSTVTCTVGMGSTSSKTVTAFGSILSTTSETPGYIGSPLGYFASVSFPGDGGKGGSISGGPTANAGSAGTAGWSASGGTAGTGSSSSGSPTGGTGGAGSNAPSVNISAYSGGAGGGGGGAAYSSASKSSVATGGTGGAGGFPGGGGGGGGAASIASGTGNSAVQGTGANGGNGAIFLIYQKAFGT
jgi:hypothetical protein